MQKKVYKKGFAVAAILLFIGVGIQPAIADSHIEPYNSELEEITIQFYETDGTFNHTVMLTKDQVAELEHIIDSFQIQLDSVDNACETEHIYKNAVLTFDKMGLLPDDMSLDYTQHLVIDKKENVCFGEIFEKIYNKIKGSVGEKENLFCFISGETNNTIFYSPSFLLFATHGLLSFTRFTIIMNWLYDINNDLWIWFLSNFGNCSINLVTFRMFLWIAIGGILNLFPGKIGTQIHYGGVTGQYRVPQEIPAEGWITTYGLLGKKNWSGTFYGSVIGFTGIKISKGFFTHYYLGTAFKIRLENRSLV
jgi:hypothetical protein